MSSTRERDYYTVAEAAKLLDVSHSTVWRWIKAGKLSAYKAGGRNLRIRQGDLTNRALFEREQRPYESLSLEEARELLGRKRTEEELERRHEIVVRTLDNRKNRLIAPMTSDELVRLSRDKDFWYGPDD